MMETLKNKPERKIWIDYVKVLGMVLIVWGHCSPSHLSAFAYAFDVQLFFWVSGYLTKNKVLPWKKFNLKILMTLIVPMLLICLIALCLSALLGRSQWSNFPMSLLLVLSGFHSWNGLPGCGAMWFVYSLMIIRVIHNMTAGKYKIQLLLSVLFLVACTFIAKQELGITNAWVDVLIAYPFFFIGNWCANVGNNHIVNKLAGITPPRIGMSAKLLIISCLFFSVYAISCVNGIAYMYLGAYGKSMLLFIIGSLLGILMMVMISGLLENTHKKEISILSSGTILMLGFQSHFFRLLTAILVKLGIERDFWSFDILTFVGSIGIVVAFYPIILLTKRYCPILMGMRK